MSNKHWLYDRIYWFDSNWPLKDKRKKFWTDLWNVVKGIALLRWIK